MNGQCYEAPLPFTLRQAQGNGSIAFWRSYFPGCAPFDRLRANGSAFWGSSSLAVHPSTGSGRTEAHFGDRLPWLCTLRQAQGERKRILGIVFPAVHPATGSGRTDCALWGSSFPAVRPSTGSGRTEAHFGDRLSWLFTLRQAQGERITLSTAKRIQSPSRRSRALSGIAQMPPVASPEKPSQTSRRSPLWHCLRAL